MGRSSRSWYSILDLLPPEQKAAYLEIKGYPPDWEPPPLEWQGEARRRPRRGRLEPMWVLAKLMRQRPGLIEQLPEALIERVEPEGE